MNTAPTARMRDPALATWTALRFAQQPLRLADIIFANDDTAHRARVSIAETRLLLDRWRGAGLIERIDKPESYIMQAKARDFRDPPAVGETARKPKPRSTRQRIWSAVRVMKSFDLVEICFAATVEKRAARRILNQLTRAGFLSRTDRAGDDQPRWRLARPSGPHHPGVEYEGRTVVALVDRNSGRRFPLSPTQKILAAEIHHVS
jgi:hypothetical protein